MKALFRVNLKMNTILIPEKIFKEMMNHCEASFPNEACGILAGIGCNVNEIYNMTNTEDSPVSYIMDAAEQFRVMKDIRQKNLSLLAIFHSHPSSPAYPSARDLALAFYEDSFYIIVSLQNGKPQTNAFIIKGQSKIQPADILIIKDI